MRSRLSQLGCQYTSVQLHCSLHKPVIQCDSAQWFLRGLLHVLPVHILISLYTIQCYCYVLLHASPLRAHQHRFNSKDHAHHSYITHCLYNNLPPYAIPAWIIRLPTPPRCHPPLAHTTRTTNLHDYATYTQKIPGPDLHRRLNSRTS